VVPLDFKAPLETAERHLRMATALEPKHYWSHCWLGLTLAKAGKMEAAELAWDACVALQPDYPTAYCFRAGALQQRWRTTADPLARQRLLDQALADCDTAVRLDPSSAMARRERASCYLCSGTYAKALDDCAEAVRLEPHAAVALIDRGVCYQRLGEYERALEDFDRAVLLAPKEPGAYRARGNLHAARGEYERAVEDLGRAIRLAPEDPNSHADRAMAHAHLERWDEALADWVKISELRPNDARVWWRVAVLRLQVGDADGYRRTCAGMLDRFGRTTDASTAEVVARACILAPGALADPSQAAELAERATRAEPDRAACKVTRGAALYRAGKFEQAARLLEGALGSAGPAEPLGRLFLSMAHARLGHASEANECFKQALARVDAGKEAAPQGGSTDPFPPLELRTLTAEAENVVKRASHTAR
jgi:tetratricopeptide (TPR) repeat protein